MALTAKFQDFNPDSREAIFHISHQSSEIEAKSLEKAFNSAETPLMVFFDVTAHDLFKRNLDISKLAGHVIGLKATALHPNESEPHYSFHSEITVRFSSHFDEYRLSLVKDAVVKLVPALSMIHLAHTKHYEEVIGFGLNL